ncbi:MAG: OPT family oligopeptide transporter [Deltaproteobacteria bacterium]|nr:MAG: OPT family oligopeptide transporter [Deltaproteobacteria bacterium]
MVANVPSHSPSSFPEPAWDVPQFTFRAIATGMVLGGILSLCNIYTGLKIGWSFNMSITSALLSFGLFHFLGKIKNTAPFGMHENAIQQTAASAAASIASAGMVSAIPAWTMLTGKTLSWGAMAVWALSVSIVGIVVGMGLRKQMLLVDKLPFPFGIATAETMKQMYSQGAEAIGKVRALLWAALFSGVLRLIVKIGKLPPLFFPGSIPWGKSDHVEAAGLKAITLKHLTWAFNPSLFMVGGGALIGMKACASLFLGAIVTWLWLAPMIISNGWVSVPLEQVDPWGLVYTPKHVWIDLVKTWLIWPGVSMMVVAALTSFAFSWRSMLGALLDLRSARKEKDPSASNRNPDVPRRWFLLSLLVVTIFSVSCQIGIFGIKWGMAIFAVALTFLLAVVAVRVSGETGITPVGSMGKVTQLTFGVIDSGNVTANLMTANVTGGAASQCADLMHDLKTGAMLGSVPRLQITAQAFGVLAGSLVGPAAYLLLIQDPHSMLMTMEWAAPAVAKWMAVAELFQKGLSSMPPGSFNAMMIGGGVGMLIAILNKTMPKKVQTFVPSAASIGLAMVIPAFYAVSFFIGGVAAWFASKFAPKWSAKYLVVLAAGLIAGESLTGILAAFFSM